MQQLDQFNTERAIVEAILAEEARPGRADSILERARRLDCDPLKVLIHEVQADQDEIYRRLAGFLGLRFSADIAPFIEPFGKDANVDAFGSLTTVAGRMRGADGAVLVSLIGLARIGRRDLWASLAFLPFYWLLAWLATVQAAIELIFRPHHWAKTHHTGLKVAPGPQATAAVSVDAKMLRPLGARAG